MLFSVRVLSALLLVFSACRNSGPPTIVRLEGPVEANSGDTVQYHCQAWDWYLEPISFYWTASRGQVLEQSSGQTRTDSYARWAAPESSGTAVLRVAVIDMDSMVARDSLSVRVRTVTRTVLNLDGLLRPGQVRTWSDSLSFGHRFQGWFDVDTGRVSFRMLDSANFRLWAAGDSFSSVYEAIQVRSDTALLGLPFSGRYHIMLDNQTGTLNQSFRMRFTSTTP